MAYQQDFLDSEQRAQEYRKKQALLKKKFALYIDDLNAAISDEEMVSSLEKMTKLVLEQQDMPSGYTKESFMKIVGLKKKAMLGKGLWGTPVDVAYKTLVMKITLVQSPNRMEAVYQTQSEQTDSVVLIGAPADGYGKGTVLY